MSQIPESLQTVAEQSDFRKTGRYDEVERLCKVYAEKWPDAVRVFEFGRTPEGRPLLALVATRTGALSAEEIRARKIPVLLLQGCIHPGESDGKDAGFLALREILEGRLCETSLERMAVLFVPVFNIDGHERVGKWNRPNQVGPEEMGWRTTSQNLNLNRDYVKADSPEMRAMLWLLGEWQPIVYADLHVTNGSDFEHDVSIQVEPTIVGDPSLHPAGKELRAQVIERLAAAGSLPLPYYPDLVRRDDPASGFENFIYSPRYSTGYWALRNRFTLLLETHSWKDYPTRVRITVNTIVALVELTAASGASWIELAEKADANAKALGGSDVHLEFAATDEATIVEFRGYAYTRTPSAVSGALATRYDPKKPAIWRVPLRNDVKPARTVTAPKGGYIVAPGFAGDVAPRLEAHAISFQRLDAPLTKAKVEAFRASTVKFQPRPFEGRMLAAVEGVWKPEERDIPPGSLFVPIAQPNARLVMAMLEPLSTDSLGAWGFFNAVYERKEYMDGYVLERVAEEMLQNDPALAAEFAQKLDADPEFARDPAGRLDFFYQRHPSFDDRFQLYPVFRTESA